MALKYTDGHAVHTEDCMSSWAEHRRDIMTPDTVAANHRLHMADVELLAGHESHDTVWAVAGAPGTGKELYCNTCRESLWSDIRILDPEEVI
jgi:hypothetical protein